MLTWQVVLPASVRAMLHVFSVGVNLGLGSTNDVFTCLGLHGYLARCTSWIEHHSRHYALVIPLLSVPDPYSNALFADYR